MLKQFPIQEKQVSCWINPHDFGAFEQSLVFIHGAGSNSSVWSYQYGRLHRQFNVAAVNLPGHGGSDGPGRPSIAGYVRALEEILDVLGVHRPVLIGHSMGAAITILLAAHHPERLSGIVAVGASATLPVNPEILEGLKNYPEMALDLICKFSLAKENRPRLYDPLRASMAASDLDVLAGDMGACHAADLTPDLSRISIPALVICGAADKMTPPEASRALADRIAGASLALIDGAGHMVMMEKPDEFNDVLINFCQEIP